MQKPVIEIKDLSKTIRGKEIIKNLNFEIYSGEVFGFLGPNGAGKTTTIRMIAGLIGMTDGDVIIQGKSIKTNFKEAIRQVGAIVENPELYPFMTGKQNLIQFARMIPGITKERIHEVIGLVGLEKAIGQKVGKYSLGMRQRLGIAQALLHSPSILILDEPTNGLDPAGIREIRRYIRKLAEEENVAVIISSHLLSEIELMCDRIGIIKHGELIDIQTVDEESVDETLPNNIKLEAKPPRKAMELLKEEYQIDAVFSRGVITCQIQKEKIPSILETFITNGIAVYEVEVSQATLEDKFFNVIGENAIG